MIRSAYALLIFAPNEVPFSVGPFDSTRSLQNWEKKFIRALESWSNIEASNNGPLDSRMVCDLDPTEDGNLPHIIAWNVDRFFQWKRESISWSKSERERLRQEYKDLMSEKDVVVQE